MANGFTDIAIRNLEATDARREIPDPGCAGLYVVVQPSGKKSFAVRYRFGKPRKLTLPGGLTLAAARKLASDALLAVEQGRDPAEAKKETQAKARATKANTVKTLCENYMKREGDKLRTAHARRRELERLVYPKIGDVPLADLKRSIIVKLLDEIEDDCKDKDAGRDGKKMADLILAYLRRIFTWHASRVDDFNSPIVQGMGRYDAKANEGKRVLSDDELRTIWTATEPDEKAPQPFHALIRFLLLTGARRKEGREMSWGEIDGTEWHLPSARNKVKIDLTRPLSKAAQAALASVPRIEGSRFIFTTTGVAPLSLSKPFENFVKATGVTDRKSVV